MVLVPRPDNPNIAAIKYFESRLDKRFLRKEDTV